jgi:hypothetical protein
MSLLLLFITIRKSKFLNYKPSTITIRETHHENEEDTEEPS